MGLGAVMQRQFGTITVEWNSEYKSPFMDDHDRAFEEGWLVADDLRFKENGATVLFIPRGYSFDGSSVPRLFQLFGLKPKGVTLWPAVAHDWCCEHPHLISRERGDALFLELAANSGAGRFKVFCYVIGIRLYSWWKRIKPVPYVKRKYKR